ncbi:hypothetical protein QAD02_023318 [Eretmocerus hayati]|uniref:Uncharacterized protein n=1 Tax=Eretmocerus hayati TaxID=131215 RepID=A0ACC2PW55_9HYME|nr:hypothetical protein QAD02_023318 [Eretmocerus hayati]
MSANKSTASESDTLFDLLESIDQDLGLDMDNNQMHIGGVTDFFVTNQFTESPLPLMNTGSITQTNNDVCEQVLGDVTLPTFSYTEINNILENVNVEEESTSTDLLTKTDVVSSGKVHQTIEQKAIVQKAVSSSVGKFGDTVSQSVRRNHDGTMLRSDKTSDSHQCVQDKSAEFGVAGPQQQIVPETQDIAHVAVIEWGAVADSTSTIHVREAQEEVYYEWPVPTQTVTHENSHRTASGADIFSSFPTHGNAQDATNSPSTNFFSSFTAHESVLKETHTASRQAAHGNFLDFDKTYTEPNTTGLVSSFSANNDLFDIVKKEYEQIISANESQSIDMNTTQNNMKRRIESYEKLSKADENNDEVIFIKQERENRERRQKLKEERKNRHEEEAASGIPNPNDNFWKPILHLEHYKATYWNSANQVLCVYCHSTLIHKNFVLKTDHNIEVPGTTDLPRCEMCNEKVGVKKPAAECAICVRAFHDYRKTIINSDKIIIHDPTVVSTPRIFFDDYSYKIGSNPWIRFQNKFLFESIKNESN